MLTLAPTALRIAPAGLKDRVRERFGDKLRRAGSFAQLTMLGAAACLDAARTAGTLGMVWTSARGALLATHSALAELRAGEPLMPYTFIATQPHLAAALFAQHVHPLARNAFLYLDAQGEPWLRELARAWFEECDRVLIGQVEESSDPALEHRSEWYLLVKP